MLTSTKTIKAAVCEYEENCECAAPGITLRWKAAYCMWLNETDDFENEGVHKCTFKSDPEHLKKAPPCKQNLYWKKMLCRQFYKNANERRSCIEDRKMVPDFVKNGAGG